MKGIIYIFLFFISTTSSVFAQTDHKKKWDKIDELKYEYVLSKLELSAHAKDQFTPVYRSYQKELRQLYQARRQFREANKNNPQKQVDDDFNMEAKQLEIKRKYRKQFENVLSPEKVKTLYAAERQFREELINQINQKK
jgi:multidrug efflux pump subunit AcrB